jgi:hypothetical protein
MKLNEEKAYRKFINAVAAPPFVELDKDLKDILESSARCWYFIYL